MEGARARQAQRGARGKRSVYAAKGPGARARGATVRTKGKGRLRGTDNGAQRDVDARESARPHDQRPLRGRSRLTPPVEGDVRHRAPAIHPPEEGLPWGDRAHQQAPPRDRNHEQRSADIPNRRG